MKLKLILLTTISVISLTNYSQTLNDVWNTNKQAIKDAVITNSNTILSNSTTVINAVKGVGTTSVPSLTNDEVIKGLKEALTVGTNTSAAVASKVNGYLKNPKLFIPWPAEAQAMKDKLMKMGFQKKITDFETSLNRAAEEAAKKSAPVFVNAITNMSIEDGFTILNGTDTSATHYLREKTFSPLKTEFMPVVKDAIAKAKVASYWKPLATAYNKIPGVKKQNPNLDDYVCTKAINGLMILIAEEEANIRKDPMARVTDLLKKVFGYKK